MGGFRPEPANHPIPTLKAPASLPRGFLSHARPLAACLSSCLLRPRHPEGRSRSVGVLTTSPGPSTFQVPDEHWLNARATASSRGSPQTFWTRTSSLSTEWKNVNEVRQVGPEMGRHPLCLPATPRGPGGRGEGLRRLRQLPFLPGERAATPSFLVTFALQKAPPPRPGAPAFLPHPASLGCPWPQSYFLPREALSPALPHTPGIRIPDDSPGLARPALARAGDGELPVPGSAGARMGREDGPSHSLRDADLRSRRVPVPAVGQLGDLCQ